MLYIRVLKKLIITVARKRCANGMEECINKRESKWAKGKFPVYVLLSELPQKMLSTFRVDLPV